MSLVPDYDDSQSSSTSSEDDECAPSQTPTKLTKQPKEKLPAPSFVGIPSPNLDADALNSSVFKNPFTEAENAKEAILQKHVKMVAAKDNVVLINGKKICWNYRKGRCRFGHNCKFAHDSDVQKTKLENDHFIANAEQQQHCQAKDNSIIPQINQENNVNKRKKRPGLTQGLVPGKKVMKLYANQKK